MNRKSRNKIEFSIVAGSLKGHRVTVPDLDVTRPPLTRLRRAIFDFLMPYIEGARYLDLYSGTGSYLFEAVSRGAADAVGVEREEELAEAINREAHRLGVSDQLICYQRDVAAALPILTQRGKRFDIVMIAPPQYRNLIDITLETMAKCDLLVPSAIIVCQHDSAETRRLRFPHFSVKQRRKYGNTTFTVLTIKEPGS
jgi:16S rRNA (guanine966-N2)-methyltransferase